MGLSIHYSGELKMQANIAMFTEELVDICTSLSWTYHLFNDNQFQGICFTPEGCEPVLFTFLPDRRLACPIAWQLQLPADTISVKTQFAGIHTHRALIHLFRYLASKYFVAFQLYDEGQYWETNDEAVLRSQFARYNQAMDLVADAISGLEHKAGETVSDLMDRLEKVLTERMKANDLKVDHEPPPIPNCWYS